MANPVLKLQTISEKFEIIKDAILAKRPVSAIYDGRIRHLCPHVLGVGKDGDYQALFYQFAGESNSRPIQPDGSAANWRCLALDRLTDIRSIDGSWHTAPDHSRPQTCVKQICYEVSF
jgi:hypothetical protein